MRKGHVVGTKREKKGAQEWYAQYALEHTARIEKEWNMHERRGYVASTNPVNGQPEALRVQVDEDGQLSSLFAPSVDQQATVYDTKEEAIEEARRRWGRI